MQAFLTFAISENQRNKLKDAKIYIKGT